MALERNKRPVDAGMKLTLFNVSFEMIAVRSYRMGERVDYKKLQDRGDTWRVRLGDWRILLAVDGQRAVVEAIENRRDAY